MKLLDTCSYISVVQRFSKFIENERLGHAYLFVGPMNVGKGKTALSVAKLANCLNVSSGLPCLQCPACLKIEKANHPDVFYIRGSQSDSIKIDQIRRLNAALQLRAYEGKKKVFILENAEHLTQEAGNALLKTLEEPSKESLFLLTTAFPERVLDTIKSRCQIVYFFSLSSAQLKEKLIQEHRLDEATAHFLAFFSEGNSGLIWKMQSEKFYKWKNEVIDSFVLSDDSESFMKGIVSDKEKTKEALNVLLSLFRDLLLLKTGIDELRFVHKDRMKDLKKIQERFSFAELSGCVDEVVKTTKMLEDNLNVKIALTLIKENIWPG